MTPPNGSSSGWSAAFVQPPFTAKLVAKPVAPVAILEQHESAIRVVQIARNRYFLDLGREIQGEFLVCHHTPTYQCSLTSYVTIRLPTNPPSSRV